MQLIQVPKILRAKNDLEVADMQKVKIGSAEIYMAFAVLSEDLENINSRPDAVIVDLFDRSQQILTGAGFCQINPQ